MHVYMYIYIYIYTHTPRVLPNRPYLLPSLNPTKKHKTNATYMGSCLPLCQQLLLLLPHKTSPLQPVRRQQDLYANVDACAFTYACTCVYTTH